MQGMLSMPVGGLSMSALTISGQLALSIPVHCRQLGLMLGVLPVMPSTADSTRHTICNEGDTKHGHALPMKCLKVQEGAHGNKSPPLCRAVVGLCAILRSAAPECQGRSPDWRAQTESDFRGSVITGRYGGGEAPGICLPPLSSCHNLAEPWSGRGRTAQT